MHLVDVIRVPASLSFYLMTLMTHSRDSCLSQLSSIENINNVSMALNVILQQVKHVFLQSIIWKFNKEPDYPPPDQWGGRKTLVEDGCHFGLSFGLFFGCLATNSFVYVCEKFTGNCSGCVWRLVCSALSATENVPNSL